MHKKNVLSLIVAILVTELAGIIGSFITAPSIPTWYSALEKPVLNPPAWVFGPVWIVLYALMGTALYIIWAKRRTHRDGTMAIGIYAGQLVLNTLWSIIFFGLQSPAGAFIEIVFLWLAILATIIAFARISKTAAWLLVPYFVWVSFAGYLNFMLWVLNS